MLITSPLEEKPNTKVKQAENEGQNIITQLNKLKKHERSCCHALHNF